MVKKKKKKNKIKYGKVGRPRHNFEFHEARELVRNEQIPSVRQYKKWWKRNTPAKIPKRPDRAYEKEWISWNDFLGNNNIFPSTKQNFRPFKEARTFVQQLGLNNKVQWFDYVRTGKKPKDIPTRPDVVYDDWFTWADWLGSDIASVKRNIETAEAIFFIIQNKNRPHNVFQLGITLEGKQTILQYQVKQQFRIVGLFYCNIDFNWKSIVEDYGKSFWEGRQDEYVINNINNFVFNITDFVEKVR